MRCTLIERKDAPQFLPKMERCNARTMEIFRRMGLAAKVRAAGLHPDVPMDVYIVRALNQPPLLRHAYPSVNEARRRIDACTDGTMPLEPYQLISQYTLEPLLKSIAETLPGVTLRYGCGRRSFTARSCSTASRSTVVRERAAITTSRMRNRRSSSCRTRRSTGRCTP